MTAAGLPFFAAFVTTILTLSFPAGSFFHRALKPLPGALVIAATFFPAPSDDPYENYAFGLLYFTHLLRILDRLYLNPPTEFVFTPPVGVPQKPSGFLWAIHLLVTDRGVGWSWQQPNLPFPSPPYPSRASFVFSRIIRLGLVWSVLALIALVEPPQPMNPIVEDLYIFSSITATIYSHLSIGYNLVAILCVTSGFPKIWASPAVWPDTFGDPMQAWSVRRLWGHTWHKHIRRFLTQPGDWIIARVPILNRNRLAKRYFSLWSTFFMSGLLHASGEWWAAGSAAEASRGLAMYCFLLQAAVITFEDALGGLTGGTNKWTRWVGRLWSLAWIAVSFSRWKSEGIRRVVGVSSKAEVVMGAANAVPNPLLGVVKGLINNYVTGE